MCICHECAHASRIVQFHVQNNLLSFSLSAFDFPVSSRNTKALFSFSHIVWLNIICFCFISLFLVKRLQARGKPVQHNVSRTE